MGSDEARFAAVYHEHYRAVYAYCRRRVTSDSVEDAVAETFLTVWRKLDDMPQSEQALPWLYGIAHRVLLHQWRSGSRRGRLVQRLQSLGVESPPAPEEYVVISNEARRVIKAASRLRAKDQEILRLSLWEELSHVEIATVLDLRVDAVRQRLSRALKNLTKEFARIDDSGSTRSVAARNESFL